MSNSVGGTSSFDAVVEGVGFQHSARGNQMAEIGQQALDDAND
jgi:hypothetical protein